MLAIDHIQLAIPPSGESAARAFFVDLLGLREERKPAALAARGGCWFRSNRVHVHCGVESPFQPQCKAHVAFLIEDLDSLVEKLNGAGVAVRWDETVASRRRFYADDPFGNRLEFIAAGNGFSERLQPLAFPAATAKVELLSPRLRLRQLRADDAAAISAYRSLPEVARFQSWETFTSDDAARLIADQETATPATPCTWLQLLLTPRETPDNVIGNCVVGDCIIGDCGIHFLADDKSQVELGITLSPAYQRRGLATEAIMSVLQYVFGTLGKHRAQAVTDADNHASASLFRRLGFRQEAHSIENVWFKGAWGSEFTFAMLQREWRATGIHAVLNHSTSP